MHYRKKNQRKYTRIYFIIVTVFLLFFTGCDQWKEERKPTIIDEVKGYTGYQREVTKEEYDLYAYFVKRDQAAELSQEELEEAIKKYASRVNAIFFLANKWNLCEPFSYGTLELRREQENAVRKVKLEKGEPIYGIRQFTKEQYFQYHLDTVEADLLTYLEGREDEYIRKNSALYYENYKERFRIREEVTYEVTIEGQTEVITATRSELNLMAKTDMFLADFLVSGEEGEVYRDGGERKVVITEIVYNEEGFENNQEIVRVAYIDRILYEEVLDIVAEDYQLVYSFDKE
ncbi:MAG: hypothetical protein IKW28_09240 [Lachnospiraceae bacterium]|nr:hypothetical protein [Lachnospiraceae bacterium]